MNTGYELRFKKETKKKLLCEKNLKREEVTKFRDAIAADTVYEMYYDNIRLREQVGVNATDPYIEMQWFHLINHLDFHFRYLGNRVKEVYVLGDIDSISMLIITYDFNDVSFSLMNSTISNFYIS